MSLRILHLMSCRGWSSDAYWAGRIARELAGRGHRVTFVARAGTDAKVLRRLRALGVGEIRTLAFRGRRAPLATARDLQAIQALLADHDLVHVHRGQEHWLAAVANALSARPRPLFRTRHITLPVAAHPLNRWLYRRATTHVVTVSAAIREQYLTAGLLPPERVTALPGGVDAVRFHPSVDGHPFRLSIGVDADAPIVGVLGRLRSRKGHLTFLDAAERVRRRRPDVRFVLIGDGPEAGRVRERVAQHGLQDVVAMLGFVAEPERAVAAFDVAVCPTVASDGMGRVVFEYMAAGRPVAATRVGLAIEVLEHGRTALLVPSGEPAALADAIVELLADRALAARLGRACREAVEARYAGAVVARELERLYEAAFAVAPAPSSP
ncbi:MAG TPA: glycosyltransferase family 4 protein [Candidatus Binatia bacterium]|nr:glycosyltransferase family 4 protein [Candidatus Binatia bacterium]